MQGPADVYETILGYDRTDDCRLDRPEAGGANAGCGAFLGMQIMPGVPAMRQSEPHWRGERRVLHLSTDSPSTTALPRRRRPMDPPADTYRRTGHCPVQ